MFFDSCHEGDRKNKKSTFSYIDMSLYSQGKKAVRSRAPLFRQRQIKKARKTYPTFFVLFSVFVHSFVVRQSGSLACGFPIRPGSPDIS
jgi:hypothetical protein